MTIASETSKSGPYTGDGANTTFAYGFKIYDEAEIQVIHTVIATGVETVLVLNTDYTVASVGSATGTITYPISGSPLPSTEKLTIVRDMTFTQLVDLQNQGGYYPETVERVFDRTEQKLQQLKEVTERCVKVDVSSSTSPDALLDDVNAAAAAAAASATASAGSATTSAASATAAGTAQTAAEAAQAATEAVYDAFDDRYLGSKTSDPALDNDGNALVVGAMYFNSVTGVLRVYASGGWTNAGQSSVTTYTYVATSSQTSFTGADANGNTLAFESSGILGVFLNGVSLREGGSYDWSSSSGTTVTLQSGATAGDIVEIKVVAAFAVADAISQTTADARYVLKTDAKEVVQTVYAASAATDSATHTSYPVAYDNTIPQSSELKTISALDLTLTPVSATNVLVFEVTLNLSPSANNIPIVVGLFKDSAANASVAWAYNAAKSGVLDSKTFVFAVLAGSTSAQTWHIAYGTSTNTETAYLNQDGTSARFGGVLFSTAKVTEFKQ